MIETREDGESEKRASSEPTWELYKEIVAPTDSAEIRGAAKQRGASSAKSPGTRGSKAFRTSPVSTPTHNTSSGSSTTSPLHNDQSFESPEEEKKDKWVRISYTAQNEWKKERFYHQPSDFVFLLFAVTLGCGAVWRFPFMLYRYGGAFLLAYLISLVMVGYPLFFVELSLGQFNSAGVVRIYMNLVPLFRGVGIAKLLILGLVVVTNNSLFSLSLFYMLSAFTPHWRHCTPASTERSWNNTPHCFSMIDRYNCVGIPPAQNASKWFLKGVCYDNSSINQVLTMIDNCVATTLNDSSLISTVRGQKNHSNCSFGLKFDFKKKGDAKRIVFGNRTEVNCSRSLCVNLEKPGNQGKALNCLFEKDAGCKTRKDDAGKLWDVVGQRVLDFRFRYPTTNRNSDTVVRRRKQLRYVLISRYHRKLSGIIQAYCEPEELIVCLKKLVIPDESFSAGEFFQQVQDMSRDLDSKEQTIRWHIPIIFTHFFGVLLVYAVIWEGRLCMSKVIYSTTTIPMLVTMALFIQSISLEGYRDGFEVLMTFRLCEFKTYDLWLEAFGQAIASLAVGTGLLEYLASYNQFHHNILRSSLFVVVANTTFCIFFSLGVFGFIGNLAHRTGTSVEELMRGGTTGVHFITFVQALTGFHRGSSTWLFLYFTLFACLSFNITCLGFNAFASALVDWWPSLAEFRPSFNAWLSLAIFEFGLPLVSQRGSLLLRILDNATHDWCVGVGLLLGLTVLHRYGFANFVEDVSMMLRSEEDEYGQPQSIAGKNKGISYLMSTLFGLVSCLLALYLASSWWLYYISVPEPTIGITITVSGIVLALCICVIAGFFIEIHSRGYELTDLFIPRPQAGPVLNVHREGRYNKLPELSVNDEPPAEHIPFNPDDEKYEPGGGWPIPDSQLETCFSGSASPTALAPGTKDGLKARKVFYSCTGSKKKKILEPPPRREEEAENWSSNQKKSKDK